MAQDPYRYFRPEATDLVGQLGAGFIELEKTGTNPALVAKLFRVAHTLKGAARIVKHKELADLAHALETWMAPLRDGGALPERLDEPLRMIDQMSAHVAALSAPAPAGQTPAPAAAPSPSPSAPTPTTSAAAPSATVPSLIAYERSDLGPLLDGLADLQIQLQQLRTLDDLRTLPRIVDHLDREVRRIREDAEQLQLVATSTLFAPLARVARDTGAQVDFVGSGGDIRLEASVIAVLLPALVQLVRNAIAHGVEPATERAAAGKPPRATIALDIAQSGGRVVVRVTDDGRGIDLAAVRDALVARGLAAPALDDHAALIAALLGGGISTAAKVTQMAGRGVGLDVVREAAAALGGELSATTRPGHGATFTLSLPLSMSTLAVVMVAGAGTVAALPMHAVRKIVAARTEHLVRGERATVLVHDDASIPYATLAQVLGGPGHAVRSIALVDRGGELVALGVEHVLGVRDIVQRARPRGVTLDPIIVGLTLGDDGVPRPVLDPAELGTAVKAARTAPVPPAVKPLPILVIDDSLTTRMLEQSILESAGYQVELASSAEEGLAKAQRGRYSLFLCDVEMPGMDGFTFVATTRADPQLSKVPAILVTSRNAPEDLRRGAEVGAKGYIVKGEFDQTELLDLISKLV